MPGEVWRGTPLDEATVAGSPGVQVAQRRAVSTLAGVVPGRLAWRARGSSEDAVRKVAWRLGGCYASLSGLTQRRPGKRAKSASVV